MKTLLLFFGMAFSVLSGFSQEKTRLYFAAPLHSDIFKKPALFKPDLTFRAAGATIYRTNKIGELDSIFVMSNDLHVYHDSIFFSLSVPEKYLAEGRVTLGPIYYPQTKNNKGNPPNYLLGNVQPLNRITVKIKSEPSGATVFFVPKFLWEQDGRLQKYNSQALSPFIVSTGSTTVTTNVQEYVYIAVFMLKNKYSTLQYAPNHLNPIDSISTTFNKIP
jgi:hypothetical protein